jgi:hypothetical protein
MLSKKLDRCLSYKNEGGQEWKHSKAIKTTKIIRRFRKMEKTKDMLNAI